MEPSQSLCYQETQTDLSKTNISLMWKFFTVSEEGVAFLPLVKQNKAKVAIKSKSKNLWKNQWTFEIKAEYANIKKQKWTN